MARGKLEVTQEFVPQDLDFFDSPSRALQKKALACIGIY